MGGLGLFLCRSRASLLGLLGGVSERLRLEGTSEGKDNCYEHKAGHSRVLNSLPWVRMAARLGDCYREISRLRRRHRQQMICPVVLPDDPDPTASIPQRDGILDL